MANKKTIRLIIADDHDIYLDGLRLLFSREPAIELVAEAVNGKQLIELSREYDPDVVITDLNMPVLDGIMAIREIVAAPEAPRVIALSTYDQEKRIVQALEAGALGYVIKNAQKGEIIEAVKMVYDGRPYYCLSTSAQLVKMIAKSSYNPYSISQASLFTPQEKQVITLICLERSSKEISATLFMSPRTVDSFRSRILAKMKVHTPAGIAIYAIKNGLFILED